MKTQQATVAIRHTMEGHVRQEKERFEKLARQMKNKEKDLAVKSDQLRLVKEVIKNSPLVSVRSTLKEANTPTSKSERKVRVLTDFMYNYYMCVCGWKYCLLFSTFSMIPIIPIAPRFF